VAFWAVTPCSDVVEHQCFGGYCCLHLQDEVKIQVAVFWALDTCSDMLGYQRFGGPCCLHLQDEVKIHACGLTGCDIL